MPKENGNERMKMDNTIRVVQKVFPFRAMRHTYIHTKRSDSRVHRTLQQL